MDWGKRRGNQIKDGGNNGSISVEHTSFRLPERKPKEGILQEEAPRECRAAVGKAPGKIFWPTETPTERVTERRKRPIEKLEKLSGFCLYAG